MILLLIKLSFVVFYGDRFVYQKVGIGGNKYEAAYRRAEFAKQDFDTVFVGSSRTAIDIAPAYFDSLTQKKTHSYNFGIISGLPPQTFDWCEELMQTKPSLKYVFFELSAGFIESGNRDDWILNLFRPSSPRRENQEMYLNFKMPIHNVPLREFLDKKDLPVAQHFSLPKVKLSHARNLQVEKEIPPAASFNEVYWNRISELIELAESKQIRIYFFIAPRLKTDSELQTVHPIYHKLDGKYKLRVAHYEESLYRADTSFDHSHLNYKGAKKFTELMAEAFDNHGF